MRDKDQELQQKLKVLFKEEATDHLKEISDGLIKLEDDPKTGEGKEIIQSLFRAAHSMKGAARAIGLQEVEYLCAALEDVLEALKSDRINPNEEFFTVLFESTETLQKIIFEEHQLSTAELTDRLENLISNKCEQKEMADEPPEESEEPRELPTPPEEKPAPAKKTAVQSDSIRISSTKIDRLLQHVEEMLMIKLTSRQKIKEIENIHSLLSGWNKTKSQQGIEKIVQDLCTFEQHRTESLQDNFTIFNRYIETQMDVFKKITEKLSQLKRLCEQDHRMVIGLVDSVIDDTKEILMQPFSTLSDGLPKMIRELSLSLNKKVTLKIEGDDIEVDRRILEQLKDPIIHTLRNAVDHGIETPEERALSGKEPKGVVAITTKQINGNTFEVKITDDGRGINFEQVKQKALEKGLIQEEEIELLSTEKLVNILYSPGFSTSPIVTDISGRGIGLNVLLENVEKLGGSITIDSIQGEGTALVITMPLTLATFRGIHIKVSDQEFIIPTHNVVRVFRAHPTHIKTVENRQTITLDDQTYSYLNLKDILNLPSPAEKNEGLTPVLIIKGSQTSIAFGVDGIFNEQEVFVKSLGKQLKKVKNISASTIMEWGKVIPILDPFDLIKSASGSSVPTTSLVEEEKVPDQERKSILIVEDSITSRMLLKNILEAAGFLVKSAVDGEDGFNLLERDTFDLVLSDVEMPRMNGFDLTKKIRSSEKFKTLPIILCTSRGSKEDRQRGINAGANAYLDKSNFMQKHLLEVIDQLL